MVRSKRSAEKWQEKQRLQDKKVFDVEAEVKKKELFEKAYLKEARGFELPDLRALKNMAPGTDYENLFRETIKNLGIGATVRFSHEPHRDMMWLTVQNGAISASVSISGLDMSKAEKLPHQEKMVWLEKILRNVLSDYEKALTAHLHTLVAATRDTPPDRKQPDYPIELLPLDPSPGTGWDDLFKEDE